MIDLANAFHEQIKELRGLMGLPDLHACFRFRCACCDKVTTLVLEVTPAWWERLAKKGKCLCCGARIELRGADPFFKAVVDAMEGGIKKGAASSREEVRVLRNRIEKLEAHKKNLRQQIKRQELLLRGAGLK